MCCSFIFLLILIKHHFSSFLELRKIVQQQIKISSWFYKIVLAKSQIRQCFSVNYCHFRTNEMEKMVCFLWKKFFCKTNFWTLLKKHYFLDYCMTTSCFLSLSHTTVTARGTCFLQKKLYFAHASTIFAFGQCFHSRCFHIFHSSTNHILYRSSTNDYLSQYPWDSLSKLCRYHKILWFTIGLGWIAWTCLALFWCYNYCVVERCILRHLISDFLLWTSYTHQTLISAIFRSWNNINKSLVTLNICGFFPLCTSFADLIW